MSGLDGEQKQAEERCAQIAQTDAATLPVPRPSDYMVWPWDTVASSSPTFDFPVTPVTDPRDSFCGRYTHIKCQTKSL